MSTDIFAHIVAGVKREVWDEALCNLPYEESEKLDDEMRGNDIFIAPHVYLNGVMTYDGGDEVVGFELRHTGSYDIAEVDLGEVQRLAALAAQWFSENLGVESKLWLVPEMN